jgi:hypothetical protein
VRTVLALEPDPRQAAALKLVVKDRVGADFVLAESKDAALIAIRSAVPDLILLTALISPRDETEIADLIRELDGAEHTQTLTIPLLDLGTSRPAKKKKRGLLSALTGETDEPSAPSGCDPAVFADEVANYLLQAEHARAEAALTRERRAKKPKRKKRDLVDDASSETAAVTGSSNYWSWDEPLEVPSVDMPAPAPEPPVTVVAASPPERQAEMAVDVAAAGPSSWDNPWGVSAQQTYLDDHIIPGPEPFIASASETVDALLEQPARATAADELASTPPTYRADFLRPTPDAGVETPTMTAPSPALDALEQAAVLAGPDEPASELEPRLQTDFEIVRAKLPTRAESGALLALQADVARLRQQRASTDATLVAAKAAQERAAQAASEAAAHAKREADRRAEEAKAERRARELAEKRAQQEAERRADVETRARQEAQRLAKEAAERARQEAAARAREEAAAERRAREQAERQAREETERRVDVERKAREEAERRAAAERKAREQAERRAKEDTARLEREARERQAHAEAERKAREAAEAHAVAERKAREHAERRARDEAERLAREAQRKAHEEADQRAKKAEQAAREQAARMAREAEARAKEEAAAERRARQRAEQRAETERKAREELERRTDAERKAREDADQAAEAARAQARPVRKATAPRKNTKAAPAPKRAKKNPDPRAVQDEWGLYDPHAAGFEALFAKLEAIENGEIAETEELAPPRRVPRPLAMWAFQFEPLVDPPAANSQRGRDEFRELVSQFSIPHAVAAVSYATGARIRNVKVAQASKRRATSEVDPRVVILSRKLLKAARKQTSTERLTARR